jgi:hypothetical protein
MWNDDDFWYFRVIGLDKKNIDVKASTNVLHFGCLSKLQPCCKMRSLPICADMFWTWPPTKKTKVTISSRLVLDNIYQSLTQSRYSHNNHYDHKMTQKPIR